MKNMIFEKEKLEESLFIKVQKANKLRKVYKDRQIEQMTKMKECEEDIVRELESIVKDYLDLIPEYSQNQMESIMIDVSKYQDYKAYLEKE